MDAKYVTVVCSSNVDLNFDSIKLSVRVYKQMNAFYNIFLLNRFLILYSGVCNTKHTFTPAAIGTWFTK